MLYRKKRFRLFSLIVAFLLVLFSVTGVFAEGEEQTPAPDGPAVTDNTGTPVPARPAETEDPETPVPVTPIATEGGGETPAPTDVAGETPEEPSIYHGELNGALPFGGLNGMQLQLGGGISTFAVPSVYVTLAARIVETMENYGTTVDLSGLNLPNNDDTLEKINICLTAVVNSYPQYFYYESTYFVVGATDGMRSIVLFLSRSEEDARAQRAELAAVILAALENVLPASAVMAKTEKALALHDYMVVHTRYNYGALYNPSAFPDAFNAYGALVKGTAVCQGIAFAYKALLQEAGVNTYVVTSENLNHAWNLVQTEYGWYHVDATWDDPAIAVDAESYEYNGDLDWMGYCMHTRFMMTEAELNEDRYTSKANDAVVQLTSGTAPQTAAASHPYSAFWKDAEGGMFYDAGYWYYNDGTLPAHHVGDQRVTLGNLRKTVYGSLFGMGTIIAENTSFAAFDGGNLYYFDHDGHSIKRYNLKSAETIKLESFTESDVVGELAIGPLSLYLAGDWEGSRVPKQRLVYILLSGGEPGEVLVLSVDISPYLGDLNGDGRANVADALLVCGYKIGGALEPEQLSLADVNGDGLVDLLDALWICR